MSLNRPFLLIGIRVWLTEVLIAGVNFVVMNRVYEPKFGELTAHQIGMTTRIAVIFTLAYLFLRYNREYTRRDLVHVGLLWLTATLIFEWGGSLLIQRRSVDDILTGWHVWQGYMWPYVLVAYATANYVVGTVIHPGRQRGPDGGVTRSQPSRRSA